MRVRLNETAKKELLETVLQKALVSAPLTLEELQVLHGLDVGALIVEHNMSYSQAKQVIIWRRNEKNRINALSLQVPIEGYTPTGVRHGSRFPALQESSSRRIVRNIIEQELDKFAIKDDHE